MTRLTEKCRPQIEMTDVFLYPCKSAPEINVEVHIGDSISISTIERCLTAACLKCPPPPPQKKQYPYIGVEVGYVLGVKQEPRAYIPSECSKIMLHRFFLVDKL